MSLQFSPLAKSVEATHGGNFTAHRLDLKTLDPFIAPIMGFDVFRMSGPTFAPHPHAGFSALSYVFEDSEGSLRNRDSLGHDLIVEPGELLWTQAASGVIHDEFPAQNGAVVHGLQVFVNLSSKHKQLAPQMFHVSQEAVPVADDGAGNRIRILSGRLDEERSPIHPAEDFDFFDIRLRGSWTYSVRRGWNAMLYSLSGVIKASIDNAERTLDANEAVGVSADGSGGVLRITSNEQAQALLLSGQDPREPVAVHGPFIMNTQDELAQAYERYHAGRMGHLAHQ